MSDETNPPNLEGSVQMFNEANPPDSEGSGQMFDETNSPDPEGSTQMSDETSTADLEGLDHYNGPDTSSPSTLASPSEPQTPELNPAPVSLPITFLSLSHFFHDFTDHVTSAFSKGRWWRNSDVVCTEQRSTGNFAGNELIPMLWHGLCLRCL
ncbi:hypothetical protein EDC04DRAFT_1553254 [Pisolithus marmoratus]|nr:hypothetical protein EDC04DRAFT_1553254 [Pisolithus marmoratus]